MSVSQSLNDGALVTHKRLLTDLGTGKKKSVTREELTTILNYAYLGYMEVVRERQNVPEEEQ